MSTIAEELDFRQRIELGLRGGGRPVAELTCQTTRAAAEQLLKDADGLVELTNMQLRLALALRHKAELLAKAKKKSAKPLTKKPKKRRPT
jgi:hypothetical protein